MEADLEHVKQVYCGIAVLHIIRILQQFHCLIIFFNLHPLRDLTTFNEMLQIYSKGENNIFSFIFY